uniref:Small ribosomal subunit protein mS39 n=1 Tax=Setaria digitata TaxID=48799 RepID=A0A915PUD3_9BILA
MCSSDKGNSGTITLEMLRSLNKWQKFGTSSFSQRLLSTAANSSENVPIGKHLSSNIKDEVDIPYAIKRTPTDLLRALATTIDIDPTAPHFALIDDPLTIPTDSQRDLYYIAKEMGRRAAQQLAEEWPTLFMYDTDIPRIEAYRPQKPPAVTDLALTVTNLQKLIAAKEVVVANQLYDKMATENIAIPRKVLVDLFCLLVYYNGKPIPTAEIPWHGWRNYGCQMEQEPQVWDVGGAADLLFEELAKDEEIYSLMIAGLCKYRNAESTTRALELYKVCGTFQSVDAGKKLLLSFSQLLKLKEMRTKDFTPTVEAYHGLITIARTWQEAVFYLNDMAQKKVKPSIRIFNVLIEKSTSVLIRDQFNTAIKILNEALAVGCKPSLHTYSLIMKSCFKQRNFSKSVTLAHLIHILGELEQNEAIELLEKGDEEFFISAMDFAHQIRNIAVAKRIISLYHAANNHVRLPAFLGEAECGEKNVPWLFSRRLIEDFITSRHILRPHLNQQLRIYLLDMDLKKMTVEQREELRDLVIKIVDIFVEISRFSKVKHLKKIHKKLESDFIADMSLVMMRLDEKERAWKFLALLLDDEAKNGEFATVSTERSPTYEVLNLLMQEALNEGNWYNASCCLQIMALYSLSENLNSEVDRIIKHCKLTLIQKKILQDFADIRS